MKKNEIRFEIEKFSCRKMIELIYSEAMPKGQYSFLKKNEYGYIKKPVELQPDCAMFYQILCAMDELDESDKNKKAYNDFFNYLPEWYKAKHTSEAKDKTDETDNPPEDTVADTKAAAVPPTGSDQTVTDISGNDSNENTQVVEKDPDARFKELYKNLEQRLKKVFCLVDCTGVGHENSKTQTNVFKYGFNIKFPDQKDAVHFVYFESSGSMRKNCVVSFIREDLKDIVEKRVAFISPDKVNLSKWFAYKGLLLSSGLRIPTFYSKDEAENKDGIAFCQDTVCIVDPKKLETFETKIIKFKKADDKEEEKVGFELTENGTSRKYCLEESKEKTEAARFDGFGIISQKYARRIANYIAKKDENPDRITSFQIRAPFTKGMLHMINDVKEEKNEVDGVEKTEEKTVSGFAYFYKTLFGQDTVTDIFGFEHNVEDIEIMMTPDMVKCVNYMTVPEGKDKKEAADYFGGIKDYEHSLYVVATNCPKPSSDTTTLNCQVLSTLDYDAFPSASFDKIVIESYKDYLKLKQNDYVKLAAIKIPDRVSQYLFDDNDPDPDTPREGDLSGSTRDSAGQENDEVSPLAGDSDQPFVYELVRRNPSFIKNPIVTRKFSSLPEDMVLSDFALARIRVPGSKFYLCGNAVDMLLDQVSEEKTNNMNLSQYSIDSNCFYAPNTNYKAYNNYSFFRNPHLSALEHCQLRPLVIKPQNDKQVDHSIFQTLFGSLHNVVMVNPASLVPMALSGADYDGDMCAIIKDETYNEAVQKTIAKYAKDNGSTDTKTEYCTSKIVMIPAPHGTDHIPLSSAKTDEEKEQAKDNECKMLTATFDSRTGHYSNNAFKFCCNRDTLPSDTGLTVDEKLAFYTAIVGLEIDGAKNGAKPSVQKELIPTKSLVSHYLNHKKLYKKQSKGNNTVYMTKNIYCDEEEKQTNQNIYVPRTHFPLIETYNSTEPETKINVSESEEKVNNVERVPYLYLRMARPKFDSVSLNDNEKKAAAELKKAFVKKLPVPDDKKLFEFENTSDWEKQLDTEKLIKFAALINAYLTAKNNITAIYLAKRRKENGKNTNEHDLNSVLSMQYAISNKDTSFKKNKHDAIALFSEKFTSTELYNIKNELHRKEKKTPSAVWQFNKDNALKELQAMNQKWEELINLLRNSDNSSIKSTVEECEKYLISEELSKIKDIINSETFSDEDLKECKDNLIRQLKQKIAPWEKIVTLLSAPKNTKTKELIENFRDKGFNILELLIGCAYTEKRIRTLEETNNDAKKGLTNAKNQSDKTQPDKNDPIHTEDTTDKDTGGDEEADSVAITEITQEETQNSLLKKYITEYRTFENVASIIDKLSTKSSNINTLDSIIKHRNEYLDSFSNIRTNYLYANTPKNKLIEKTTTEYNTILENENDGFRYVYFLTKYLDKKWHFAEDICSKQISEDILTVNKKDIVLNVLEAKKEIRKTNPEIKNNSDEMEKLLNEKLKSFTLFGETWYYYRDLNYRHLNYRHLKIKKAQPHKKKMFRPRKKAKNAQ